LTASGISATATASFLSAPPSTSSSGTTASSALTGPARGGDKAENPTRVLDANALREGLVDQRHPGAGVRGATAE
jgi:hypothetical protein